MKNITLAIDEDVLFEVRKIAAERETSVNALVREYLAELAARKRRSADALKRMRELAEQGGMEVGARTWSRDDTHER